MISHRQAQSLISARLDGPLDPVENRELLTHLATCPTCQRFAEQTNALARSLRDLPHLPASPSVNRQVLERISAGRSPWAKLALFFNPSRSPVAAATAALVLIAAVAFAVIIRSGVEPQTHVAAPVGIVSTNQAQATATRAAVLAQVTHPTPTPTATTAPTATSTATATPPPTAMATVTTAPTPHQTTQPAVAPTTANQPTATRPVAAANTAPATGLAPAVATTQPAATSTPVPTATATATAEPTATEVPTATPEPTPTELPTAGIIAGSPVAVPATETPTPTPEPTATPTVTPTATPTPPIQQRATGSVIPTTTAPPITNREGTSKVTNYSGSSSFSGPRIVPRSTTDPAAVPPSTAATGSEPNLSTAATVAALPRGAVAPTGALAVSAGDDAAVVRGADGGLGVDDFAKGYFPLGQSVSRPIWSPKGALLLVSYLPNGSSEPSIAVFDRTTDQLKPITQEGDGGVPHRDVPAGWIGQDLYYQRTFPGQSGRVELHRALCDGSDDQTIWSSDQLTTLTDQPIATDQGFIIATDRGWLLIDGEGQAQTLTGNGPDVAISQGTLNPTGGLLAYVTGNGLVVAAADHPGTVIAAIPYHGAGYSWSPSGQELVVSESQTLQIYTSSGHLLETLAGGSGQPVSAPHWSTSGIWFVESGPAAAIRLLSGSFAGS